jgi:23S rRNA (guanosine2251-2'-O)-methyltransferase
VVDSVQDPRNLGAILRTAEVAGVHGVVLPKRRIARGKTVEKASAGALQYLPIVNVPNIKHALSKFRERGITVYAAEAGGQMLYWEADMTVPLTIVIGSEGEGIKRTVKSYADSVITIPIRGKINSLNVSVATGILLYEVLRQRRKI